MSDSIYTVQTLRRAVPLSLYRDMVKQLGRIVCALIFGVMLVTVLAYYLDVPMTSHFILLALVFSAFAGTTYITELSNLFDLEESTTEEPPDDKPIVFVKTYYRSLNCFLIVSFGAFVVDSLIVISGITGDLSLTGQMAAAVFPVLVGIVPVFLATSSKGSQT